MARVLVTGASGFVMGHLAVHLGERGYQVLAIGGKSPVPKEVAEKTTIAALDLRNYEETAACVEEFNPEVIVNGAALADASFCEGNPGEAERVNGHVVRHLVQLTRKIENCRIIQISTDLVFDGSKAPKGGFDETSTPTPLSAYGKSKLLGEKFVLESGLRGSSVVRTCLVHGPKIGPKGGSMGWIVDSLEQNKELTLFEDEWRTPVSIFEINEIIDRLIRTESMAKSPSPRLFHASGAERLSRYEFGVLVCEAGGYNTALLKKGRQKDFQGKAPRPEDVSLSGSKSLEELSLTQGSPRQYLKSYL